MYDAIIVGGGPAGLSAALVLGRCRRRVIVCDAGSPRNAHSHHLHGFLTRDGIDPAELLRIGRDQLTPYGIELIHEPVTDATCMQGGFRVTLAGSRQMSSRTLLLATGIVDRLPTIEGFDDLYGRSVFHCPYCDGWEVRDAPLAVYGKGRRGAGLSLSLKTWSSDIVLCTDGGSLSGDLQERLNDESIRIERAPIARLTGTDGMLDAVVFKDGRRLARTALFFSTGQAQRSNLPAALGCAFTSRGTVRTNKLEGTEVPGLYVAGDASRDVQLAIVAAAEGAKAAFAINTELQAREGRRL